MNVFSGMLGFDKKINILKLQLYTTIKIN